MEKQREKPWKHCEKKSTKHQILKLCFLFPVNSSLFLQVFVCLTCAKQTVVGQQPTPFVEFTVTLSLLQWHSLAVFQSIVYVLQS